MVNLNLFQDKIYLFYLLLGIFFFIIFTSYIWNLTVDDAFISFRYASNLVQGHGLVWNIGENPIEGYSNFLWVLIFSVVLFFKLDPVIMSKLIGLASLFGVIFVYWKLTDDIFNGDKKYILLSFSIAVLFLLANPATVLHVVSGLETMFYSFLIMVLIFCAYKFMNTIEKKYIWLFSLFALLISFLRFEGVLIVLSLLVLFSVKIRFDRKFDKKFLIPVICIFFIPLTVYMVLRFQYFNEIYPMSFFAKSVSQNHLNVFISNIKYFYNILLYLIPFFIVNLIIIFYVIRKDLSNKFLNLILICTLIFISGNIIYFLTSLEMNYGARFIYPSFIYIYLITGISLTLMSKKTNFKTQIRIDKVIPQITIILLLLLANATFISGFTYMHEYGNKINNTQITIGKALQPYSQYNYTVATDYAGAIPYYSGWHHIDMLGLNDKYIAKNYPTLDYVREVKPDLIIIPLNPNGELANEKFKPFLVYAQENNYTMIKLPWNEFIYYLNPKIEKYNEIKQTLNELNNREFS